MSTTPTFAPNLSRAAWFPNFLRQELAPYPGRAVTVARIVISATLTAVLIMVFRIPNGSFAVVLATVLSRENILVSARTGLTRVAAFALTALFIPIGGRLFAAIPLTHFLWEAASVFLCFFLMRTLTNFATASSLAMMVTSILAIWYLPGPASRNVELTLWQVAAASLGVTVTLAVGLVFHLAQRRDEVISGVDERLKQMQLLMTAYAEERPLPADAVRDISRYAVVGMGGLRRHILRMAETSHRRAQLSTLVSLAGRSIDFAAGLAASTPLLRQPEHRLRAARLAGHIAEIRLYLESPRPPEARLAPWEPEELVGSPLLNEIDALMSLIPAALSDDDALDSLKALDPRLKILDTSREEPRLFVADAFTSPEHLRYALSGTLAAMLCYILYMGLAWPTLATSVTTCVMTGLSNIGTSRQKQVLRVSGAVLGGFVFGMGAQILVMPYLDSIGGFVVLIGAVTAVTAWVTTASSRLSYAGLQMALAFYLITINEPTINTSLTVARDRVLGVLLGIFMMWLVFERFYPRPAVNQMVTIFVRNLRLMADLAGTTVVDADEAEILRIRRQRERIYSHFGKVNAQMDAIPFETGPQRERNMAARDRIRRWQAAQRAFYLMQAPLLQFRVFADAAERDRPLYRLEDRLREVCAESLRWIASSLESQLQGKPAEETGLPPALRVPEGGLVAHFDAMKQTCGEFTKPEQSLYRMMRTLLGVVDRTTREVAAEPLFATE